MEIMETVDKITPRYGTIKTQYHHIYGVDVPCDPFINEVMTKSKKVFLAHKK